MVSKLSEFLSTVPSVPITSTLSLPIEIEENTKNKKKEFQFTIDNNLIEFFYELEFLSLSSQEENNNKRKIISVKKSIDTQKLCELLKNQIALNIEFIANIIINASNILEKESNVIYVNAPITIVGDLHGQFYDLLGIFDKNGFPGEINKSNNENRSQKYLFLGDYVDRGYYSCEIIILLLFLKVKNKNDIYLLRGNHETRNISTFYGFKEECNRKYGPYIYNLIINCFEKLPLAAMINISNDNNNNTFLALHGGLSPEINTIQDILNINRFTEPPPSGALCDLLWSDPLKENFSSTLKKSSMGCNDNHIKKNPFKTQKNQEMFFKGQKKEENKQEIVQEWQYNPVRGCSVFFSKKVALRFLKENHLSAIIRAHEMENAGFYEHYDSFENDLNMKQSYTFPPIITIFSAPNYCNRYQNKGAILHLKSNQTSHLEYDQYDACDQPTPRFWNSEKEAFQYYISSEIPYMPWSFPGLVANAKKLLESMVIITKDTFEYENIKSSYMNPEEEIKSKVNDYQNIKEKNDKEKDNKTHIVTNNKLKSLRLASANYNPDGQTDDSWWFRRTACGPATPTRASIISGRQVKDTLTSPILDERNSNVAYHFVAPKIAMIQNLIIKNIKNDEIKKKIDTKIITKKDKNLTNSKKDRNRVEYLRSIFEKKYKRDEFIVKNDNEHIKKSKHNDKIVNNKSSSNDTTRIKITMDSFTKKELQALKMFFLTLNRSQNKEITRDHIALFLEDEDPDAFATKEEMDTLMEAMDADKDDVISIVDFIQFSYRLKKMNELL